MNIFEITGDWNVIKGCSPGGWIQLTEEDLLSVEGKREAPWSRNQPEPVRAKGPATNPTGTVIVDTSHADNRFAPRQEHARPGAGNPC